MIFNVSLELKLRLFRSFKLVFFEMDIFFVIFMTKI